MQAVMSACHEWQKISISTSVCHWVIKIFFFKVKEVCLSSQIILIYFQLKSTYSEHAKPNISIFLKTKTGFFHVLRKSDFDSSIRQNDMIRWIFLQRSHVHVLLSCIKMAHVGFSHILICGINCDYPCYVWGKD